MDTREERKMVGSAMSNVGLYKGEGPVAREGVLLTTGACVETGLVERSDPKQRYKYPARNTNLPQ